MKLQVNEACKLIGVKEVTMYMSKKYQPFITRTEGKREVLFDIDSYRKYEERKDILIKTAGLLVEYLNKAEGMSYTIIAELGKTYISNVHKGDISLNIARNLVKNLLVKYPFHANRFEEWYDMKLTPITNVKILG
jgi:hypothetical protein